MPVIVTGPDPAEIVVTVVQPVAVLVPLPAPTTITVGTVQGLPGPAGPTGPAGPAGEAIAFETVFATPLATWVVAVPVGFGGRTPNVGVYIGGQSVIAEVHASPTQVSVILPEPLTGSVVLN